MLSLQKVEHTLGNKCLFSDLNVTVSEGQRIGIVGSNGVGKSTLVKIISGEIKPHKGMVVSRKGLKIAIADQLLSSNESQERVFDYVAARTAEYSGCSSTRFHVERALEMAEISPSLWDSKLENLSGGQLNWCRFAGVVAANPDLAIFDEPTNHLDLESIARIERLIQKLDCAYLVISHDRVFLDRCTTRTLFIFGQQLHQFQAPFSEAREYLTAATEAAAQKRREEILEVERLREASERIMRWAVYNDKLARRGKNIEKRADKLEENLTEVLSETKTTIAVSEAEMRSKIAISIQQLSVTSPVGQVLYSIESLTVKTGEKVFIQGPNGSGKSTLLNILHKSYHDTENLCQNIRFNPQSKIGYYDQELSSFDFNSSLIANVRSQTHNIENGRLIPELVTAGFPFERHQVLVKSLSGGERARLKLLILKLLNPTVLILDEPTNHIDFLGCEQLEALLKTSSATCIIVSHDRAFMENVGGTCYVIAKNQMQLLTNFNEYFESLKSPPKNSSADTHENTELCSDTQEEKEKLAEAELFEKIEKLEQRLEFLQKGNMSHSKALKIAQIKAEITRLYEGQTL